MKAELVFKSTIVSLQENNEEIRCSLYPDRIDLRDAGSCPSNSNAWLISRTVSISDDGDYYHGSTGIPYYYSSPCMFNITAR